MTCDEQLAKWVDGDSIHNETRDECCPDFSYCNPELLAPEHERQAFAQGDEATRMQMLMTFLGKLLEGQKVHIAGGPYERGG